MSLDNEEYFDRIMAKLDDLGKRLSALSSKISGGAASKSGDNEIADDADLDGKFGNEEIRKMPSAKYWEGEDFTGQRMSETTPEFMDAFARYKSACAFMNEKSGDESKAKYIGYDRRSAARARGWAKRMREGHPSAKSPTVGGVLDETDAPF